MEDVKAKRYAHGGVVKDYKMPVIDRAWWKCKKCGVIFESYSKPPTDHYCLEKV